MQLQPLSLSVLSVTVDLLHTIRPSKLLARQLGKSVPHIIYWVDILQLLLTRVSPPLTPAHRPALAVTGQSARVFCAARARFSTDSVRYATVFYGIRSRINLVHWFCHQSHASTVCRSMCLFSLSLCTFWTTSIAVSDTSASREDGLECAL